MIKTVGDLEKSQYQRRRDMAVTVIADECVGCESCIPACPVEAITMVEEKAIIDQAKCDACGTCIAECPTEAIKED